MAKTYTVVSGDTLWDIANTYKDDIVGSTTQARIDTLVELNNIPNPNYIVVGQVLKLNGTKAETTSNNTSKATIDVFGLQSNTDRTVYATWTWSKSNTENYRVIWYYDTGDSVWFIGNDSETDDRQSTYNAPSNAKRVKFKVKPISKTKKVNDKETAYWTAGWSTEKTYDFSSNPPTAPSAPSVEIEKYKLTAKLANLDVNGEGIQFQIVKNDSSVFKTGTAKIITSAATYSCNVDAGHEYKVRCRAYKGSVYSEWSDYSSNVATMPAAPSGITTIRASSETSVYLEWRAVTSAKTYELEYTTKKEYFDGSDSTTKVSAIEFTHFEKTGLESGQEYFFRVRAVNEKGESAWSGIKSVVIGKKPAAPTTWSSTTTAVSGDPLILYWVHNSEDGSSQTYAEIELYVDDVLETYTIKNTEDEEEKDKTSFYSLDTSEYVEGVKIQWRVRTAGVTKDYGDWSVQRTIDIYAPPTLELGVTDSNGESLETITSFPFYISALAGPNTQMPIGYHLIIKSNEVYETVDNLGNPKTVNNGEEVYSKYFDTSEKLLVELSAGSVDLENNIRYTVVCSVSMDSGLTTESTCEFVVSWTDIEYEPNAEIGIDTDTYTASIRPFCEYFPTLYYKLEYNSETGLYNTTTETLTWDEVKDGVLMEDAATEDNEAVYVATTADASFVYYRITQSAEPAPVEDAMLSVYRREFDGSFTELARDLNNADNIYITDPHPALDYARYRIVATSKTTGSVSYCDLPGYPVGGIAAIIQWDEDWTNFDISNEDEMVQPPWSGSMLKLPYNIDVSDSHKPDVALIEYIGREHPTSYYGTQIGHSSNWKVDIPADDKETLYALRRLAKWMGDVYVREPSGSGYWANITVSYSQQHCDVIIPVTFDVKRVEGGV